MKIISQRSRRRVNTRVNTIVRLWNSIKEIPVQRAKFWLMLWKYTLLTEESKMDYPGYKLRERAVDVAVWTVVLIVLLAFRFPEIGSAGDDNVPTFTKDVAPILFKNCVNCHRTGELASEVPLISYEMVRPRAELIKQKVMTREMPPNMI
jgi:hypothetical protein